MCDVVTIQQVGSYAINNQKPSRARRDTKKVKQVIHPCFLEYSQYVDDPEWQHLFVEAAHGKLPRGFLFSGGILSRQGKRASARKNLHELDPRAAATACMNFFRLQEGNHSSRDQESNREHHRQYMLDTMQQPDLVWSKLGGTTQLVFVSRFLGKLRDTYSEDDDAYQQLKSFLHSSLTLCQIEEKDITMKGNQIDSIDRLTRLPSDEWTIS